LLGGVGRALATAFGTVQGPSGASA
jgi:expansin (peptidoglycan-binding protein)